MGRFRKALMAALTAGLAALSTALPDGLTGGEITWILGALVVAFGTSWGVPISGFLDLSRLDPAQRAELDRFLNLR
jgi:hypothetical protein